jgi:hypothetical protein
VLTAADHAELGRLLFAIAGILAIPATLLTFLPLRIRHVR